MKPLNESIPARNVAGISDVIERALAAAGLGGSTAPMQPASHTLGQTLSNPDLNPGRFSASPDNVMGKHPLGRTPPRRLDPFAGQGAGTAPAKQGYPGEFTSHSYRGPTGALDYKLYVPTSYAARTSESFPLIVMLHGCTQSPDDFAAGTRMNVLAEKHGFVVAYPAQAVSKNGSKCWNWFRSEDQQRDAGEPSLIAGVTHEVAARFRIDERRIFVAGLSAGAAMAVVLGETYPELYAGVGAHSGLARGTAHDVPSALAAMRGGGPARTGTSTASPSPRSGARLMPTIVFHGDRDKTVDVKNGVEIVERATAIGKNRVDWNVTVEHGVGENEGRFTRTIYADGNRPLVESWLLHGAGHAWSGGSSNGSFTEAHGPDASSAMIQFFYSQPCC